MNPIVFSPLNNQWKNPKEEKACKTDEEDAPPAFGTTLPAD